MEFDDHRINRRHDYRGTTLKGNLYARFTTGVVLGFLLTVCLASVGSAQPMLEERVQPIGGGDVLAPPPPPPLSIQDFRIFYTHIDDKYEAETTVRLKWTGISSVEGYTVHRQRVQLVLGASGDGAVAFQIPGPAAVSPSGWKQIGVNDRWYRDTFVDRDIPDLDLSLPATGRRPLETQYCYRVEGVGGERTARSPAICTRLRGINAPRIQSVSAVSATQIGLLWDDTSDLESGFTVSYRLADGGAWQTVTLNGEDRERYVLAGLSPSTRYCVRVFSFDYYGVSRPAYTEPACLETEDPEEVGPKDKIGQVSLQRQTIIQGNIPYVGQFPAFGTLPNGILREVRGIAGFPRLYFVKPGFDTSQCTNSSAVIVLEPDGMLSPSDLEVLWGSEEPDLPLLFIACAEATSQLFNWIPVKVTYRTDS